eukprot:gene5670-7056_t
MDVNNQQQQQQEVGGSDIGSFRDFTLDDSLYSRQRYVLGDFAMSRLSKSDVFLSGLGGVGVEIAKNLILAGLKSITLHDTTPVTNDDLSTQFYIDESQYGKNRAIVSQHFLSELNPYVKVNTSQLSFDDILLDLSFLLQFKCVILTESDSYGLFGWVFSDFGINFKVYDKNGEDIKETFIANISNAQEGIVTCLENQLHNLEDYDTVSFKEVQGMAEINETHHKVKVISPVSFSIGDTSQFSTYERSGIVSSVKTTQSIDFQSLRESISHPEFLDFDFMKNPKPIHLARQTLETFRERFGRLPKPWDETEADNFINLAKELNQNPEFFDLELLKKMSYTCTGKLCPISSIIGGFAAQEALKSLTGKFTPLKQWLYIDAIELYPGDDYRPPSTGDQENPSSLLSRRSYGQSICIGDESCRKLENSKLFMIGSGAIGCEMLKNYALLGVGSGREGKITITDNDLIEKSNLNRQFLFRSHDINNPKSSVASLAVKKMNPTINIDAHQHKVDINSESIYNPEFYQSLDLVVSALDNVEARMYVDSMCVANKKPLLESGTLGTKGHVQVILPNLTESYSSQKDPNEKQTPFCTLKSFPSNLDHCIQWSRDKFEKFFCINPSELDKFIHEEDFIEKLLNSQASNKISLSKTLSKLISNYPRNFNDCITFSRVKFEKLFNHSILQLLKSYPLDLKTKEGIPFWTSPKRPPTPLVFNSTDNAHLDFIEHSSYLWAKILNIPIPDGCNRSYISEYSKTVQVPPFNPKNKVIISDEKAQAPVETFSLEKFYELTQQLQIQMDKLRKSFNGITIDNLQPQQFEKDDDSNHHIDFITATANLRARIYSITEADRFKVKLIAGKIIPAIATTTSVVSGLVSLELIKILIGKRDLVQYKNVFLNLAIPSFSISEPGIAPKMKVTSNFYYTLWDKWDVTNSDITIDGFINLFLDKYNLKVSGIYQNVAMIYMSALPSHTKRLSLKLKDLLNDTQGLKYIDLFVSFQEENGDDARGPPIRFYLDWKRILNMLEINFLVIGQYRFEYNLENSLHQEPVNHYKL